MGGVTCLPEVVQAGIDTISFYLCLEGSAAIEKVARLPGKPVAYRGTMLGEHASWGEWAHTFGCRAIWRPERKRLYLFPKLAPANGLCPIDQGFYGPKQYAQRRREARLLGLRVEDAARLKSTSTWKRSFEPMPRRRHGEPSAARHWQKPRDRVRGAPAGCPRQGAPAGPRAPVPGVTSDRSSRSVIPGTSMENC
jgi:hypothetical protein